MKKTNILLILILLLIMNTGCSDKVETNVVGEAPSNDIIEMDDVNRDNIGRADIFGKVSRIVGNEVTLALIEMPKVDESNEKKQKAERSADGFQGAMNMEPNYTGETIKLIIPVGVPILARGKGIQEEKDLSDIIAGSMIMIWTNETDEPYKVQLLGSR